MLARRLAVAVSANLLAVQLALTSVVGPPAHKTDPTKIGVDVVPPATPQVQVASIARGKGPVSNRDGTFSDVSTDDLGWLRLTVSGLDDNDSAPEEMGLRLVSSDTVSEIGQTIMRLGDICPTYIASDSTWQIGVVWVDGGTDKQEPLALRVLVYAIDSAGNLSAVADTLDVVHPGRP